MAQAGYLHPSARARPLLQFHLTTRIEGGVADSDFALCIEWIGVGAGEASERASKQATKTRVPPACNRRLFLQTPPPLFCS